MRHLSPALSMFFGTLCVIAFAEPLPAFVPGSHETPGQDIPWGAPLDGGELRAVLIAPIYTLRDGALLAHHLEMDLEVVPLWSATQAVPAADAVPDYWGQRDPWAESVASLEERPDVIIAAGFSFSQMPPEIWTQVTTAVEAGAGLVLANHQEQAPAFLQDFLNALETVEAPGVVDGAGLEFAPELRSAHVVRAGAFGSGRVCELQYGSGGAGGDMFHCLLPPLNNPSRADHAYLDTYLSLAARAVRWAARRDPEVRVADIRTVVKVPDDMASESEAKTRFELPLQRSYGELEVVLASAAPRDLTVRASLRQEGRGRFVSYVGAQPLKKGESTYRLYLGAGPGVYSLDIWLLDGDAVAEWYSQGIELAGSPSLGEVTLSRTVLQPNDLLDVSAAVRFLDRDAPRPVLLFGRARDPFGRVVATATAALAANERHGTVTLDFADLLAPEVVIELYAVADEEGVPSEGQLLRAPFLARRVPVLQPVERGHAFRLIGGNAGAEYNRRYFLERLRAAGVDAARIASGDEAARFCTENGLRPIAEIDLPPGQAEIPGDWLENHGAALTLQGVPAADISSFLSFVRPDSLREPETVLGLARALIEDRYSSIEAYNRAWGTSVSSWEALRWPENVRPGGPAESPGTAVVVAEAQTRLAAEDARQSVNLLRAGFAGAVGADAVRIEDTFDFAVIPSSGDCVPATPGTPSSEWSGLLYRPTGHSPESARWAPWYAAFSGLSAVYVDGFDARPRPMLRPDGAPTEALAAVAGASQRLKEGIALLLRTASLRHSGLALYSNRASEIVASQEEAESGALLRDAIAKAGATAIRLDSVLALARGDLEWRVLVLPAVPCLSDDDAASIRAFSDAGGVVVADRIPGRYDELGTPRAVSPLTDLFGPGGRNVLLESPDVSLLRDVLAQAGVSSLAALDEGEAAPDCAVFEYTLGDAYLVGLLRDPGAEDMREVRLRLPEERQVYSLLSPQKDRKRETLEANLAPGEAALFAALPYEVKKLKLTAPSGVKPGDRLPVMVAVEAKADSLSNHVVRLELHDAAGKLVQPYEQNIVCEKGQGKAYFPLAVNEDVGAYTVVARDVMSGMTAEQRVEVRSEQGELRPAGTLVKGIIRSTKSPAGPD